jgi:prepilin peptidase CpaA
LTPEQFKTVQAASVGVSVIVGAAWDVATRRVPNALTFTSATSALVLATWQSGVHGLTESASGLLTGLALFLPFFALGGMGAGDVKLLAAVGAWLGPWGAFWAAVWTSLAGGAFAVVIAVAHNYLGTALLNLARLISVWRVGGLAPVPNLTLADTGAPRLTYAVAIAFGAGITLWVG